MSDFYFNHIRCKTGGEQVSYSSPGVSVSAVKAVTSVELKVYALKFGSPH